MSRRALFVAMLLMLVAAPASAQEPEKAPDETVATSTVEPARPEPATQLFVGELTIIAGGERVEQAPAGERVTLRLAIHNSSDKPANDVAMRVGEIPDGVTIADTTITVGDIASNGTATATLSAEVAERGCTDFVGFAVTLTSSLGEHPSKVGFGVACPGPKLSIFEVRFDGGDGDGVPEPGEALSVLITLANDGRDPATDVQGTVSFDNEDITVVRGSTTWPDIAPRARAAATTPLAIRIADDAKTEKGCEAVTPGPMVIDDGDQPVSSDGGGTTGSTGAGSSSSSTGAEPADEPRMIAPAPDGETRDLPATQEEPVREPDPAVGFEMTLKMTASGTSSSLPYGTRVVCAFAESRTGAPTDGRADLAATKTGSKEQGRGGPVTAAVVLLIAVGTLLVRQVVASRGAGTPTDG